jgi:FkbM family methyltransferase
MLFRSENLNNVLTAISANNLPWIGRALYALNQLVGTRLCRPSFGRLIRRACGERVPHWDLTIPLSAVHNDIVVSALFFGTYEFAEIFLAREFLYPEGDVVELGASMGVLSAHVSRRLRPGARLLCVEPNLRLHDAIKQTIRANSPSARSTLVAAAVYYGPSKSVTLDGSDANSVRISDTGASDGTSVSVTSLSAVLREHAVGPYTLICDIEGSEAGLLVSDGGALKQCREILIETHEAEFQGRRFTTGDYLDPLVKTPSSLA